MAATWDDSDEPSPCTGSGVDADATVGVSAAADADMTVPGGAEVAAVTNAPVDFGDTVPLDGDAGMGVPAGTLLSSPPSRE